MTASIARAGSHVVAERSGPLLGDLHGPRADDDAVGEASDGGGMLGRRDAEAGVERNGGRCAGTVDEAGEGGGDLGAGAGRAGERDEVQPAVGARGAERDPLVGRRGRDELDPRNIVVLLDRQVDDDRARGSRGARVGREPLVAVRLEDRGVGHRDERDLDAGSGLGDALEALPGAHAAREGALGGALDGRALGERVGERDPELDDVGAALDRGLDELRGLRLAHEIDDELGHSVIRPAPSSLRRHAPGPPRDPCRLARKGRRRRAPRRGRACGRGRASSRAPG